jgi:hypothetical protein
MLALIFAGHEMVWSDPHWGWIVVGAAGGMLFLKFLERCGK